jgi:ADP-heptose:LPS heptosyltransferase
MKKGKYSNFILFSPGSVGDHLVMVDFANHFFESTKVPSKLLLKHPSAFLHSLATPYLDHISHLDFTGTKGALKVLALAARSVYQKNCYVLLFPIPLPRYMKAFVYFIRFFTRSRFVGFNHEGTKFFPLGSGYASILGKENCIPLEAEMFYESANKMLAFLGYKPIDRTPRLDYVYQQSILDKLHLQKGEYIVMHVVPSYKFRSLPQDRWNGIIKELLRQLPGVKIVFTGSVKDIPYIESCLLDIPRDDIVIAAGKTEKGAQELLTLYANAKVNVTVQTGNGLIINMLHVPTVVVNIKGTAMFYYDFNEQATILFSEKDCICDPFRTSCNFIQYKGGEYMACIFNIKDEDIISAVLEKYNEN